MSERVIAITGGHGALGQAVLSAARDAGGGAGLKIAVIDHAMGNPVPQGVLALGGVDLTDPKQAEAAITGVISRFGRLDVLLNIAGGFVWQTTDDAAPAWDRMHALNVATALNASRAALPYLKASDEGRIINIGSAAALKPGAGMGAYGAAKAGVHALTQALAEELKSTRVTVNAVLPSIIDTPANRKDMPDAEPATWVAPADLAAVILFLASPESRAMTGALVPVTGRV